MTMDDNTNATAGLNVRRARLYAGLTLQQLADRIGRSKGWLSMIENGHLALDKRGDIAAIAEACEVSADMLLGQPAPEITPGRRPYSLAPMRAVLLDATLDDPPDVAARPLSQLADLAGRMDQALRKADYDSLHAGLPGLLGELQVCVATGDGGGQDRALRLLVAATATAAIMLKHFGRTDLAWIAADRGQRAAALTGDPVQVAAAAFGSAHCTNSANRPRVLMSMPAAADRLEPLVGDDRFAREVYGMIRLSAALACAVDGNHDGAREHGAEAASVAAGLGDRPEAFEVFGIANAGVWRTSLAVEAGNAAEALAYADRVQPQALASSNRRAALRMERARAEWMLGHDDTAVRELRRAEKLSPMQVRNHPMIREQVGMMLRKAQREAGGRELRGLAWRMGVRPA
jgi:transcriptional regulator with XRE-family HTH domain